MVAVPGEQKGCDARTHHACARSAAELHEGRAGDPRPGDARPRPARRAHRAALRRTDVRGFLRPARPAPAGRGPGGRFGQPRAADGRRADRPGTIGHLAREGPPADAGPLVGNPMIDTLLASMDRFDTAAARTGLGLPDRY